MKQQENELASPLRDDMVTVTLERTSQAIVTFLGDGFPVVLEDDTRAIDLPDLFHNPIQRAVLATRLRAWANLIEAVDE